MRLMGLLGIAFMISVGFLLSTNRNKIRWQLVGWGLGLQFILAIIVLKTSIGRDFFASLNDVVILILDATKSGAEFVFGNLAKYPFGPMPLSEGKGMVTIAAGFAFVVLPTIIFFSSLMAILYHLGVMQLIVHGVAWVMAKTMKTSGPETLSCAANIFVGQTEAPLVVRPFIKDMTLSEITAVMTGGFATIAGGVLVAYVMMLKDTVPGIAGHLIAASVMSAPAALMMAKIFMPETQSVKSMKQINTSIKKVDQNVIDAAARGATDGMTLAMNVAAMLIAFLAIVKLINMGLGFLGDKVFDFNELTLAWIFGKVLSPLAFLLGVPWDDAAKIGDLLGTKIFLTEFIAYGKLSVYAAAGMSVKAKIIATYALCGFANVGSIGIQLGGIGAIAPERRGDLAKVALRAMVAGAFASFITACIAGMLL